MKVISHWASKEVFLSRILITILFVMLFVCSAILGVILSDMQYDLPMGLAYLPIAIYLILLAAYPILKREFNLHKHYKRRLCLNSMGILSFVLITLVGVNQSTVSYTHLTLPTTPYV